MTSNSDEDEKALVVKRLTALAAMLSRGAPLPSDFPSVIPDPTQEPEKRPERVPVAPEPIPEPVSRRMDKPLEVLPDGKIKVRGHTRKAKRGTGSWYLDWDNAINGREE